MARRGGIDLLGMVLCLSMGTWTAGCRGGDTTNLVAWDAAALDADASGLADPGGGDQDGASPTDGEGAAPTQDAVPSGDGPQDAYPPLKDTTGKPDASGDVLDSQAPVPVSGGGGQCAALDAPAWVVNACGAPFSTIGLPLRFQLDVVLPDGKTFYVHDYLSDAAPPYFNYLCASVGGLAQVSQKTDCWTVAFANSFTSLALKIADVEYTGKLAGALDEGSTFAPSTCVPIGTSEVWTGPAINAVIVGKLASANGDLVAVTGTIRNALGAGAKDRLIKEMPISFDGTAMAILLRKDGKVVAIATNSAHLIDPASLTVTSNPLPVFTSMPMLAPDDGLILAAMNGSKVSRVDPDGKPAWKASWNFDKLKQMAVRPAVASDGRIFVALPDWKMDAHLLVADAKGAWIGDTLLPQIGEPASLVVLADGTAVIASTTQPLLAVVSSTGAISLKKYCGSPGWFGSADLSVLTDGQINIRTDAMYSVDLNGDMVWKYPLYAGNDPTSGSTGRTHFGSGKGLIEIDVAGAVTLKGPTGGSDLPTAELANGHVLHIVNGWDKLGILIDWAPNGTVAWAMQVPEDVRDLAVDDQGRIYLLVPRGVVVVQGDAGLANSPWPLRNAGRRQASAVDAVTP